MWKWFKNNWIVIVVGILGLLAGFAWTTYANVQSEKRIIAAIVAQIALLKEKEATGRLSTANQTRLNELEKYLNFLKI